MKTDANKLKAALGPTAECIAIEELIPLLEGQRGDVQQIRAKAHVESCPHCQSELALLRSFEESPVRPEEREAVNAIVAKLRRNPVMPQPEPWWKRIRNTRFVAPTLAAVAAAVIAIVVLLPSRHSPNQNFAPGNEVLRSAAIEVVAPIGDLSRPPREFAWREFPGAAQYRVRVLEVDRTELWNATTSSTSLALPPSVLVKLQPLKTMTWDVQALDIAGNVIGDSGLQRFRLVTPVFK